MKKEIAVEIRSADDPIALSAARELIRAHVSAHSAAHDPAQTDALVAALPDPYNPPDGGLWVAFVDGEPAASAALRKLDDETGEVKRMYVTPARRGQGIARTLVRHVIQEARSRGYSCLRLGTLESMKPAQLLYESEGFRSIPPYRSIEFGDTLFYELSLKGRPSEP